MFPAKLKHFFLLMVFSSFGEPKDQRFLRGRLQEGVEERGLRFAGIDFRKRGLRTDE